MTVMNTEQEHIQALVKHWCPEFSQETETFPVQVMRAFLAATACAADQRRKLDGKEPIRPLDSYPNPMKFME